MAINGHNLDKTPESADSGGILAILKEKTGIVAAAATGILALQLNTAQAADQKPIQVADASGSLIVLANYSETGITAEDAKHVMQGKDEIVAGLLVSKRFQKGRYKKMSDTEKREKAEKMAGRYIVAFLENKDTGNIVASIALSPKIVDYVAQNPKKFPLASELASELEISQNQVETAQNHAQIAALQRLNETLASN